MKLRFLKSLALGAALFVGREAAAQPFAITAQVGNSTTSAAPGGTIPVVAPSIGAAVPIKIAVSYQGGSTATITGVYQTGSGDFTSPGVAVPIALSSGGAFTTTVTYKPSTGQTSQAQLSISYLEGQATVPASFVVNIAGTAPDLIYSYVFAGGNAQAVSDGGSIQFPAATVSSTATATFTIQNRGGGSGAVSNVALTGAAAFALGGLGLPPFTIPPGSSLTFTVAFTPTDRTTQTGTLTISFAGRDYRINLQGAGVSSNYTYTVIAADNTSTAVQPGQTVAFPKANIGSSAALTLVIANNGNGPGTINAISITGTGFQLGSTPFLPATIAVGAQIQIGLSFSPPAPGTVTGALKIGDDTFGLNGVGVGSSLSYSYTIGASSSAVSAGGSILFSPTKVGASSVVVVNVMNAGNATASITTIFLSGSPVFTLDGLPALPINLDSGAALSFNVRFAPTATGIAPQSSLQIGNATFTISASAIAPDPLPAAVLSGPSGTVQPLQQPVFSLSLQQPYSIDVTGTLTLGFSSAVFATDPSVQFASGGQTVAFTIPAGKTSAMFANNTTQIAIQTGTVAGAISIVASFATTGGVVLTPPSPPNATLNVPQLAPQVTGLSLTGQTSSGFTLVITGYSTSLSVTQLQLVLTSAPGQSIANPTITIPVDATFRSWYQASQSAGSQFTASLPITLSGNSSAPSTLTTAIQSVSVTLSNAQGVSATQSITIP